MQDVLQGTPFVLAAVPVVLGIVQAVKAAGLPSRFAPLASLALGIGLSFLVGAFWREAILQGVIVGLSASGLWSGAKAVSGKTEPSSAGT